MKLKDFLVLLVLIWSIIKVFLIINFFVTYIITKTYENEFEPINS